LVPIIYYHPNHPYPFRGERGHRKYSASIHPPFENGGLLEVVLIKNLELRTKIHKTLAETAVDAKNQKLLEAEFVARSNNMLHALHEEELGRKRTVNYGKIFEDWRRWLEEETKGEGRRSLREILQSRE
jgi:hypothetical protein